MQFQCSYNSHNYLMDIALENINSGQRQRFNGPSNQRNPAVMGNPRGPPNSLPTPDTNQYQQGQQGNRPNNPRFPSPTYPPQNNYRGPPQRQNNREDLQQQQPNYPQYNSKPNPSYQQEHPPQQRQNPPKFPPPPQRDHRSQPRQNQFEERPEPTNRNQNMPNHYQQQRNYDQEQPRFERRQPYNRDQANNSRQRQQEGGKPYQQNANQRYRGNQHNERANQYNERGNQHNERGYSQQNQRSYPQQNDRSYQNRNDSRPQNNMQRADQYEGDRERGRGRGGDRGGDRGRGRGRGRGRQISRAIQQSEYHSLPPIKKPQEKVDQPQEESGSESGSEQMSQEAQDSRQASSKSQSSGREESGMEDRSDDSGLAEENSAPEGEEQSGSQAIQSEEPVAVRVAARRESQSEASLNLQQIHTMCSKDEFNERLETFTTNNRNLEGNMVRLDTGRSFAIFEINKKTGEPDYALTLKRYRRSTNRSEDQDDKDEETDLPRSRTGLMMAIKHIHKEIIDADNVKERELAFPFPPGENRIQFLHIFDFLWNRMREMIKDVSRLDMRDRSSAEIIIMCEQMLRFFIIAIREGKLPHSCRLQFDPKLNLESITKILTQLLEIYEESHMKLHKDGSASIFISPNEPEIIGYAIIISNDIQKTLNEKLMIRLNGEGLEHPLLASKEIQNALRIKKALKNRDYETFYGILQDESTDYVLSCLMMHHLPIVRRETLRTIYRSSYTDSMTKAKKLPEETFRQALRFKAKQHHEFKEFLKAIKATVGNENGESFIFLGQIEDNFEENHMASSYIFESNKLLRSGYGLKACAKRLSNPNLLSREELTKRSWFDGKYAQLAKRYYNSTAEEEQSEEEQIQQKLVSAKKEEKKQSVPMPQLQKVSPASPIPQTDGNKINFLVMKRKELERNKFIKNLENLIQNLIKNSDIHSQHKRKKGLQTILQLTDLSRVLVLESAFTRLAEYANAKRTVEQTLKELEKFRKIKVEFESIYNRGTFQFGRREKPVNVKMSELLNQGRRPKEQNILKKLFKVYKDSEPSGKRRLRTLYIFTTEKKSLSEGQKSFLINFYSYISLGSKKTESQAQVYINRLLDVKYDNWIEFQKSMISTESSSIISLDYSFTIFHYRIGSNCEIPFLSGYDAVVFIDLWKSITTFSSLIKEFQEGRKKIFRNQNRAVPPHSQSYLVLHVGSTEGNWQSGSLTEYNKQMSKKEVQWESSWQRLESQAIKISPCLKITMTSFLSAQLREPEQQHPDFAIYSLSSLIDQVERNLECVSGEELKREVNSLQFLEAYFNQSLECIRRAVLATAGSYEGFDWKEILEEAIYSKAGPSKYLTFQTPPDTIFHEERLNLNHELFKKFTFSLELISSLKLSLSSGYVAAMRQRSESGLYVLSQLVESYLQGLCKEEIEEYFSCLVAYVVQNNCHMVLTDTVSGDCKNLFQFLLSKVKQKLKFCNVILPRGFDFRISKSSLSASFTQNEKKIERGVAKSQIFKKAEGKSRKDLSYCRSAILSQLLQEIEEGQEEDDVVELKPAGNKAIKMR